MCIRDSNAHFLYADFKGEEVRVQVAGLLEKEAQKCEKSWLEFAVQCEGYNGEESADSHHAQQMNALASFIQANKGLQSDQIQLGLERLFITVSTSKACNDMLDALDNVDLFLKPKDLFEYLEKIKSSFQDFVRNDIEKENRDKKKEALIQRKKKLEDKVKSKQVLWSRSNTGDRQ
eukprot:TRINITY_DN20220_c0_g1_i1.p1 TRINITY_DN20220_c0_g1~~TRINITY_DN20220_c0_g1_i1.p1  ORF type:complete len:176 (-),score=32.53 TRINITY_DN20220_c0_g1_i1:423-950(-)